MPAAPVKMLESGMKSLRAEGPSISDLIASIFPRCDILEDMRTIFVTSCSAPSIFLISNPYHLRVVLRIYTMPPKARNALLITIDEAAQWLNFSSC